MNLSNTPCVNVRTVPGLGPHVKHAILDFHAFLQELILVCIYTHRHFCMWKQKLSDFQVIFCLIILGCISADWDCSGRQCILRVFPFPEPGMLPLSETGMTLAFLAAPFEVTGTAQRSLHCCLLEDIYYTDVIHHLDFVGARLCNLWFCISAFLNHGCTLSRDFCWAVTSPFLDSLNNGLIKNPVRFHNYHESLHTVCIWQIPNSIGVVFVVRPCHLFVSADSSRSCQILLYIRNCHLLMFLPFIFPSCCLPFSLLEYKIL